MDWRQYLLLLASCGVLIGLAMGLHYGHMHHESAEEPAAVEATPEAPPWPPTLKARMIENCASTEVEGLPRTSREQCTCTFDWYEKHMALGDYLEWSNTMGTGGTLGDEANELFQRAASECSEIIVVTPEAR